MRNLITLNEATSPMLNNPITSHEIMKCINKLKNNKSPESDMILNEYIKNTKDIMCPLYVKLFNKILDTGDFPSELLVGVIIPLYKNKGDINYCNNYSYNSTELLRHIIYKYFK